MDIKLVELRPCRELLDLNVSGYKLSLDPIPMHDTALPAKVDHLLRSEEQFSLQHVKLFGLHNHLLYDPWNLDDVYYVDTDKTVKRNTVDKETKKLNGVSKVWDIPGTRKRRAGHYSPSGFFPAKDLVLFSDGAGTLHLIHSGERNKSDDGESQWKVLFTNEVCGEDVPFVIVHAIDFAEVKDESDNIIEGRKVHCLLLHVEELRNVKGLEYINSRDKSLKLTRSSFVSILEWIILKEGKNGSWSVGRKRKLCGKAIPEYAAVCKDGISLTISSEEPFLFFLDTGKPIGDETPDDEKELVDEAEEKKKLLDCTSTGIKWMENLDIVKVTLPLGQPDEDNKEIAVNIINGNEVTVTSCDRVVLRGSLRHSLDQDLTTWEIKDKKLIVTFHKKEKGLIWRRKFEEGTLGVEREREYDPDVDGLFDDGSIVDEPVQGPSRLCSEQVNSFSGCGMEARMRDVAESLPPQQSAGAGATPVFNSQELEECDEASTKDASLSRFHGEKHVITHKTIISQWLFNVQLDPEAMPVICLRDGEDALLWQPKCDKISEDEAKSKPADEIWNCTHVASFMAFGYVQASKERKKFNVCATDTSYVAVCEASTYIYVYRKPSELSENTELRNRRTGEKVSRVARQQLITLPNAQEVLGVHASSTTLYVLMEDKLLAYTLNQ